MKGISVKYCPLYHFLCFFYYYFIFITLPWHPEARNFHAFIWSNIHYCSLRKQTKHAEEEESKKKKKSPLRSDFQSSITLSTLVLYSHIPPLTHSLIVNFTQISWTHMSGYPSTPCPRQIFLKSILLILTCARQRVFSTHFKIVFLWACMMLQCQWIGVLVVQEKPGNRPESTFSRCFNGTKIAFFIGRIR